MTLLNWETEKLAVGIDEIDQQHRKLVAMINELHEAMLAKRGATVVDDILRRMIEYARYHFGTEERLMKTHVYPAAPDHLAQHEVFRERTDSMKETLETSGPMLLSIELSDFLADWLKKHIRGTDQAFAAFLKTRGVR